jgi:Photosynthesis system II assembly factor YCF48
MIRSVHGRRIKLTRILLGLTFVLLAVLPVGAAHAAGAWTPQASGTARMLRSVAFADATHGWAVGDSGTILSTTDGGAHWTPQTSATAHALFSVAFTDATHGWAVGEAGTIISTTDGGAHWTARTSGTTNFLSSVAFADATHGWAVGYAGTILKTTDGGAHWTLQSSGTSRELLSVTFADATHGWAVGEGGTVLHWRLASPTLSNPVAPATMLHTRSYTVYATLRPRHAAGTYPVRIYKYRRLVTGIWKPYGYVRARAANYSTYTKCLASVKLPYPGTWRLRAYAPADNAHSAKWSSGYDYVTAK